MRFDFSLGQTRRSFVKIFALTTASSFLFGRPWTAKVLAEISANAVADVGVWRVKVSDYPALRNAFGSVRIGTAKLVGTFSESVFPPLLINRGDNNQFSAFDARCTHENCVVPTPNPSTRISTCPCHLSRFRFDGTVLPGSEARDPLRPFKTTFDGIDLLSIEIPDIEFLKVTVSRIANSADRLQLRFLAFGNTDYEIHARETLTVPWQTISFATNPTGQFNQTVLKGNDDFANVYVPIQPATNFFAIAVKTLPI